MSRGPSWFRAKAGKRDASHAKIRHALERLGYLIADLGGAAGGVADLAVLARQRTGEWRWLEIKSPKGTLTAEQKKLHAHWLAKGVKIHVVRSVEDALRVVRNEGVLP
jgi:hypothetical protein